jgi:hypothetical protein
LSANGPCCPAVADDAGALSHQENGLRELIDFDELGVQYPCVGISTLKVNVKKSPDMTLRFVRTMVVDGIPLFRTHKEKASR